MPCQVYLLLNLNTSILCTCMYVAIKIVFPSTIMQLQLDPTEPMDTTPPSSEERVELTSLNQEQDTFETILLQLLQTFTNNQRQSKAKSSLIENGCLPLDGACPTKVNISAEALSTLSPEQVMALVTSNSVNYEVIQQIRTQKNKQKQAKTPGNAPALAGDDISQQLLQVSPEQLMQLNSQVTELLNQRKVSIPSELPPDEQLKLIQSLLVKQLNEPQSVNSSTPTAEPTPPKKVCNDHTYILYLIQSSRLSHAPAYMYSVYSMILV